MPLTKEDRIKTVMGGGGHVVILGAGASIASTLRNPELSGKKLPSMANFIQVVELQDIVESLPDNLVSKNFEDLYTNLHNDNPLSDEIFKIEKSVYDYFKDMKLPDEPTIYDYLVLSLRPKDLIATFNWDPFLYQAWTRNRELTEDSPHVSFLHGNVSIGFSKDDKRSGPAGWYSKETKNFMEPSKFLFPIEKKDYASDEFIITEWDRLKYWLNHESTKRVTVFGYGTPKSDYEAIKILNDAWGTRDERNMEQFEIIDIKKENEVRENWDNFIHSHHYDYATNYFDSILAHNPRRTSESYFQHYLPMNSAEAFSKSNPVPNDFKTLEELWDWHKPLIAAENEWKLKNMENENNG